MNILDKAISFIDPKAGLNRAQRRAAISIIERGYEGARRDKRTKGWNATDDYNNGKILSEIEMLRKRSRDLFKNNPYSWKAHTAIANNTIGTGILPAIADVKTKIAWNEWSCSTKVDFDEHFDFAGIQSLCMKTMSVHGEVLVLKIKTDNKKRIPLELKALPPIYLDTSKNETHTASGGWVIGGVEFSITGKRKGYWIFDRNPSEDHSESKFWDKEDVIHLYQIDEPGQLRGVPFGTPSMMTLRDYDDYADAQLMRQKIAACFSVFITETDSGSSIGSTSEEDRLERVEPGIIEHLEPGKKVEFASPPPAEGYKDYSRNVLTGIAAGYGISHEAMTGDLSNMSFSSGRLGWLEFQRNIEAWQWFIIIPKLCKKVWEWFLEAGIISGDLAKNAPTSVEWTAPRRQMIDPVKETKGLVAQIRAGLISWQEAVRSLGFTPEEIIEEMKAAAKMFDDAGLKPVSDPRYDSTLSGKVNDSGDKSEAND